MLRSLAHSYSVSSSLLTRQGVQVNFLSKLACVYDNSTGKEIAFYCMSFVDPSIQNSKIILNFYPYGYLLEPQIICGKKSEMPHK